MLMKNMTHQKDQNTSEGPKKIRAYVVKFSVFRNDGTGLDVLKCREVDISDSETILTYDSQIATGFT